MEWRRGRARIQSNPSGCVAWDRERRSSARTWPDILGWRPNYPSRKSCASISEWRQTGKRKPTLFKTQNIQLWHHLLSFLKILIVYLVIVSVSTFIVEVKEKEWGRQRVQALPVDVLRVLVDPRFENALELGMALRRSEQVHVLVTPWNIHFNLSNWAWI